MNVLFASSEVAPFAKTGGLADVSGSLPKALNGVSVRTTVILPFYRCVKKLGLDFTSLRNDEFNFFKHTKDNIDYIFVINDKYYDRDNLYSEPRGDYEDNNLRFSYFSKAIAAFAAKSYFKPDIIHCNDWQTGLVPLYLKIGKSDIKTLFTIHNIGYQGLFRKNSLNKLDLPRRFYAMNGIEYYGKISFLKSGIVYSTAVSTVSKGYAREILTREFGCGMEGILKTRLPNIYGIVNGADYGDWNPEIDKHLACNYDAETVEKKIECKKDLIKSAGLLAKNLERPLIGVISRLAEQKGIDLIVDSGRSIVNLGSSVVILGTGDEKYNNLCKHMAEEYPEYVRSYIKFDNALAHKIEAGSDIFAMPSRYEPCGLNQLYSMRYGTLPVVRATGGLDDTVIDIDVDPERGNGIKFVNATSEELTGAISRAIELYRNKKEWRHVQKRIMKLDFSWDKSALEYKGLYAKLIHLK